MRLPSRRGDDADVIRARLRALLEDRDRARGWVPDDDPFDDPDAEGWEDRTATVPVDELVSDDGVPAGLGRHRAPDRTARWDPGRLGARSLWAAGVVAALLLIGWTWLHRPSVEPAPVLPAGSAALTTGPAQSPVGEVAETSAVVVVSVVGTVARPGLVTLPSGARVAEAVEAAGGLLPDADPASVNLAAVVSDGQQIVVGVPGGAVDVTDPAGSAAAPAGPVNLNTAGVAELDALPGVGPVLAQRIVDHRKQSPFTSVDELDDVPGIGPARAAELADLVTV
ncbi:ComEA family DNA-binding protein [Blastococcus sp. CT_GayMR16]|uniref:ComEA family DNA-binding protein n=1 Tax=Blastococcus sp. CT_GayMR16 TaxID=2559607 RepID=UPI0010733AA4|nr:ComEA family DNA-binding protein [Blastococcus sp. CT_GayMR16]TFV91271.1 ComEA family DNA-binding protein [Blastococcus sp. CT_GayMR16]